MSTDRPFAFHPDEDTHDSFQRLLIHLRTEVIPKAISMAHFDELEKFHFDIRDGMGQPEKYLCIKAWRKKSLALDEEFELAMRQVPLDVSKRMLTEFYRNLRTSDEAKNLMPD